MKPTKWRDKPMPCCGFLTRGASTRQGSETPTPGDVCICINCGAWCRFTDHRGSTRKMQQPELAEFHVATLVEMMASTLYIRQRGRLPKDQW